MTGNLFSRQITPKIISSVPLVEIAIPNEDGTKTDISKEIQDYHRKLLRRARRAFSRCEYVFFIDYINKTAEVVRGEERRIDLPEELKERIAAAENNSIVALHNHPNNSLFSFEDIHFLLSFDSLYALSAIGHNGDVHLLIKQRDFSLINEAGNVLMEYMRYRQEGLDLHSFFQNVSQYGLIYRHLSS